MNFLGLLFLNMKAVIAFLICCHANKIVNYFIYYVYVPDEAIDLFCSGSLIHSRYVLTRKDFLYILRLKFH